MLLLILSLLGPAWSQEEPPTAEGEEQPLALLQAPELLTFVEATYPEQAKQQGIEGRVLLALQIDAEGLVTDVQVLQPAGHGFDEAAIEAARQLGFSPALDANGPVPVAIEFAYGFSLSAEEAPAAELPVNLEGSVLAMGTRRPLADFPVRAQAADGSTLDAITDEEGRFSFRGVPPGPVRVTAGVAGLSSSEQVQIYEGELTALRLWVRAEGLGEDQMVVIGQRETPDVTRRTITVEEIRRIPGTFGDPVRVIQNLPGAARAPFGTGLLVIRGANPEDSAVYIDGIRIPLIYHLGGYSSVINADLVESVDYLPGGYGVAYGRSMGGVVDVRTTTDFPEQHRVVWNTDVLDTGVLYEGRVGRDDKLGLAVAARRSYIDALLPVLVPDTGFVIKPRWYDYQLKLAQQRSPAEGSWSFFLFGFQDKLVASTPPGFAQGTDPDTQGDLGTTYETHRAYFQYRKDLTDSLSLRLVPSLGVDGVDFSLGSQFRVEQWQLLAEVRAELVWEPHEAFQLTPGVDFIGGLYWFETQLAFDPGSLGEYDPLAEREPWSTGSNGGGWGPDLYLDARLRPLKDRERLVLYPGLRANIVTITDARLEEPMLQIIGVDPRLNGRFKATGGGTLKGGLGIYHQPPQPFEAWRPEGTVDLDFERSLATELGWEQQLTEALSADAAVFYKRLDRLIVENEAFSGIDDAYFFNRGVGRIYGTELMLRHARVDRFFGWVSYTLSRSERNDDLSGRAKGLLFENVDEDAWYSFQFDQTHILVAVAGLQLPQAWEVSGKLQYVTGNPYTPYAGGIYDIDQDSYFGYSAAAENSSRLPPFIALDLRVQKLLTFKAWQLELYLDLLNVVRGENPEFTLYNYDYTESRYIRGLPFIPSPGFQAEFYF